MKQTDQFESLTNAVKNSTENSENVVQPISSKLMANDGIAGDFFGKSVAADKTKFIVATISSDSPPIFHHGSAYVYTDSAKFDFDGDGKTDIAVVRGASGLSRFSQLP